MSVTVNELTKRVKRGAHFMDAKRKDWALGIALSDLRMDNEKACILGQSYGNYNDAAEDLGLLKWKGDTPKDAKAIYRGFALNANEEKPRNWSALAELWAVEVALRQVRAAQ